MKWVFDAAVFPMMPYAGVIWVQGLNLATERSELNKLHRLALVYVCSAYGLPSTAAVGALLGMAPAGEQVSWRMYSCCVTSHQFRIMVWTICH